MLVFFLSTQFDNITLFTQIWRIHWLYFSLPKLSAYAQYDSQINFSHYKNVSRHSLIHLTLGIFIRLELHQLSACHGSWSLSMPAVNNMDENSNSGYHSTAWSASDGGAFHRCVWNTFAHCGPQMHIPTSLIFAIINQLGLYSAHSLDMGCIQYVHKLLVQGFISLAKRKHKEGLIRLCSL